MCVYIASVGRKPGLIHRARSDEQKINKEKEEVESGKYDCSEAHCATSACQQQQQQRRRIQALQYVSY